MAKNKERTRTTDYEDWYDRQTPARRLFWVWLRTIDKQDRRESQTYVDYVGECGEYVRRYLGEEIDIYDLESCRKVVMIKERLYKNPVFKKHADGADGNPLLIEALDKFSQYMENREKESGVTDKIEDIADYWLSSSSHLRADSLK